MKELVTDQEFKDHVLDAAKDKVVVVDFFASWCGPCKMLLPIVTDLDATNEDTTVNYFKVNIDSNQPLTAHYGVMSVPTLIYFKNGVEVKRTTGVLSKEDILAKVDECKNVTEENTTT